MELEQAAQAVARWAEEGERTSPPSWQDLPSIPLYMDQVILYLGENLKLFQRDEDSSLLTSSMINNYVKRKNSFPNAPLTIVLKESFSKPVAYNSNWDLLPHWKHLMAPFLPNW